MQPPNEEFFTLFSQAGSNIIECHRSPGGAHKRRERNADRASRFQLPYLAIHSRSRKHNSPQKRSTMKLRVPLLLS
jgi:hypothetical protein